MLEKKLKYSNKTNVPSGYVSDKNELPVEINNQNIRKTTQGNYKIKEDEELNSLLTKMKKKMDESNINKNNIQSKSHIADNSINISNNMNQNNNFNNQIFGNNMNISNIPNINSNDISNNMINMNNSKIINMDNQNNNIFSDNKFNTGKILNMNNQNNIIFPDNNFNTGKILNMNNQNIDNNNNFSGNNNFMNMNMNTSKILDKYKKNNNSNSINMNNIMDMNNNNNFPENNNFMNNNMPNINNNINKNNAGFINNMNNNNLLFNNGNDINNPKIQDNPKIKNSQNYMVNPINNINEMMAQRSNENISNEQKFNPDNIISNKIIASTMFDSGNIKSGLIPKITNKEQQNTNDQIRKTQIINRHSVELTKYYDYSDDQTENELNKLIEEICLFGDLAKEEIKREKESNPNKYMSIEEAMQKGMTSTQYNFNYFPNQYFVLSILAKALMIQGCEVAIEREEPQNEEGQKEINTTIQFLVNGMFDFKKYDFIFDFGEEKNKEIINNEKEQKIFKAKLKGKLVHLFKLNHNEIILTKPRLGSLKISAIIKKYKFNEFAEDILLQEFKKDSEFNKIKKIEKNILLSGCKLNPYMLDSRGNNRDGGWGINEKRGGCPYYPPEGWIGFGLRVLDRYDYGDNSWLDYRNLEGEWAVAYHGIGSSLQGVQIFNAFNNIVLNSLQTGIRKAFKNSNDHLHEGNKVGDGVYLTPQPSVMEKYSGTFNIEGKNYKIAFMTRVRPDRIRSPEEEKDYWVINGTDNEVRPYRILIKEA